MCPEEQTWLPELCCWKATARGCSVESPDVRLAGPWVWEEFPDLGSAVHSPDCWIFRKNTEACKWRVVQKEELQSVFVVLHYKSHECEELQGVHKNGEV